MPSGLSSSTLSVELAARVERPWITARNVLLGRQAPYILGEPRHVERAVRHPDTDGVGPGTGVLSAPTEDQGVAGVAADVIARLVLLQQFDGSVDAAGHDIPLSADPNVDKLARSISRLQDHTGKISGDGRPKKSGE